MVDAEISVSNRRWSGRVEVETLFTLPLRICHPITSNCPRPPRRTSTFSVYFVSFILLVIVRLSSLKRESSTDREALAWFSEAIVFSLASVTLPALP